MNLSYIPPSGFRLLLLLPLLSSCSYKIHRNYLVKQSVYVPCEVAIKKDYLPPVSSQFVGEIKLGDTGFTTGCKESDALVVLKREACSLNAQLICIEEEERPDMLSSCYRCTAKFYTYTDTTEVITSDPQYKKTSLASRDEEDRKRKSRIFWVSFALGFMIGFLIVL